MTQITTICTNNSQRADAAVCAVLRLRDIREIGQAARLSEVVL